MGQSLRDAVQEFGACYEEVQPCIDVALQRFFSVRIGIQLLMGHYVASSRRREQFAGLVQLEGSLAEIAQKAARQSMHLCQAHLGQTPRIVVEEEGPRPLTFIPAHLTYALVEVFKNACRAATEAHVSRCAIGGVPAVMCRISHSDTTAEVTVTDRGAGMDSAGLQDAWKFMYTSCKQERKSCTSTTLLRSPTPLAGHGIGLPMSRLYMRHFGGDLRLVSREGVGTHAHLTLSRIKAQQESLPELPSAQPTAGTHGLAPWQWRVPSFSERAADAPSQSRAGSCHPFFPWLPPWPALHAF